MVQLNLKTSICIEPSKLGENIDKMLLENLKTTVLNSCDKNNGYIVDVISIIDYDNIISNATSQIIFTIIYLAECIKPCIGDIVKAKVMNVTSDGIFCIVYDRCKTIIPANRLNPDFTKKFKIGEEIDAEIVNIRYDNKNFSCIATISI